jgi:HEAT repeat protein
LRAALSDADEDVRYQAAIACARIMERPPFRPVTEYDYEVHWTSQEQHIAALKSSDPKKRSTAAWMLGRFGLEAALAIPDLMVALGDADAGVRVEAANALGRIGPIAEAAVPGLRTMLRDRDEDAMVAAACALHQIEGMP